MADKKIIAVVGATGAQGGGLVRAIVNDPGSGFVARAITRDVNSEKAQALAKLGVEVVAANLDDADSLARAFAGAYGVFCLTNFWEHFSPEKEYAQVQAQAAAAKNAAVHHAIWSTLEDTRKWVPLTDNRMPTLMGKYKVPHFDAKGEADQEFTKRGVPTTFLLTSFYWDNMISFGMGPKKGPDGKALKFVHRGSYDNMDNTYEAITNYLDEHKLEAKDMFIEQYLTDPLTANEDHLVVNVYVLVK